MGKTGSGKSHVGLYRRPPISRVSQIYSQFINIAAGLAVATNNSHDLTIRHFVLQDPRSKRSIVLVDTPGFDRITAADEEIQSKIVHWIRTSSALFSHFTSSLLTLQPHIGALRTRNLGVSSIYMISPLEKPRDHFRS